MVFLYLLILIVLQKSIVSEDIVAHVRGRFQNICKPVDSYFKICVVTNTHACTKFTYKAVLKKFV